MLCIKKSINISLVLSSLIVLLNANFAKSANGSIQTSQPQQHSGNAFNLIAQNYSRVYKHNNHQPRSLVAASNDCGGIYRNVQTTIKSPGYPVVYPPDVYCKYSFMSPYACQTQFHIQFLDFALESSINCSRDRLEIGHSEVLCGKVIGIMKYKAMNGLLRITFKSNEAGENRGYHLLVTRLPCINGDGSENNGVDDVDASEVHPVYERETTKVSAVAEFEENSRGLSVDGDIEKSEVTTENYILNDGLSQKSDDGIANPILDLLPPKSKNSLTAQRNSNLPPFWYSGWGSGYGSPQSNGFPTLTPNCWYPPHEQPQRPPYPYTPPGYYPPSNNQPPVYYPTTSNYPPAVYPPANNPPTHYYPSQGAPPNSIPQQPEFSTPTGNYPYFPAANLPPQNYPSAGAYPSQGNYPQPTNPTNNGYIPPSTNLNPAFDDTNPQNPVEFPSTNVISSPNYPTNPSICNPNYNQCQFRASFPAHSVYPQSTFTASQRDPFDPTNQTTPSVEAQAQVYVPSTNLARCCARTFNQRHFYLTSPGFPSRNTQPNIDCLYFIERNHPGICRLIIEFKFFLVGSFNQQLSCEADSFLEIDGQRVCGCNTGLRYVSQWGLGAKTIRLRSTSIIAQNVRGFVLDVVQEECPYRIRKDGGVRQNENIDRSDETHVYSVQPARLHSAAVEQRNSSSLITYYYYSQDDAVLPPKTLESKEQFDNRSESPTSSQFIFLSGVNSGDRCTFGYGHWLKLITDPLWKLRPVCNRY